MRRLTDTRDADADETLMDNRQGLNQKLPNVQTQVDIPMDGLELPDGKMKNTVMNNSKHIGNSIYKDNGDVIENDYSNKKVVHLDEDSVSNNSLGSHKNRKLKSESGSHKSSNDSLDDGEEKKDASKEDLEDGTLLDGTLTRTRLSFVLRLRPPDTRGIPRFSNSPPSYIYVCFEDVVLKTWFDFPFSCSLGTSQTETRELFHKEKSSFCCLCVTNRQRV
ncbi:hypothetical protein SK128_008820 [Halocaridina rubra]|uniref:Uncharacterized protein n=1 Tax=Halocaridina rubra TaxID=373956 RepID=A0AAN8X1Q5_HALRR